MAKLIWDKVGERFYETGVSKGVLYVAGETAGTYATGVAWNGLSSVSLNPSGAEPSAVYADNIKYLNLLSAEELEATIEAYTYPDAFAACQGSLEVEDGMFIGQQNRKTFAFCYQTKIGNDLDSEVGFKLHIVYGALAAPTERASETVNDSPEAATFSWDITTTPVEVTGFKPTALVTIDSTKADEEALAILLEKLYGRDAVPEGDGGTPAAITALDPTLLMPDAIATILGA